MTQAGSPTAANRMDEIGIRRTPIQMVGRLAIGWMDGWMAGQSAIGWIRSRPDGSDRPADRITNKPAGKPTKHRPSIRPIDREQQTKQPTIRLACYKSNHRYSIYPTDRKPTTNQAKFLQAIIAWISGIGIWHTPIFVWLAARLYTYKQYTSDVHTCPHFSVWSALLHLTLIWTPFLITQFLRWGVWPITGQVMGLLRTSRGIHVYTNPRFDGHLCPLTISGNAPYGWSALPCH